MVDTMTDCLPSTNKPLLGLYQKFTWGMAFDNEYVTPRGGRASVNDGIRADMSVHHLVEVVCSLGASS